MTLRGALRARLLAAPAITARVGQRVSWLTRPQAAGLPAITLQMISGERPQHLKGFEAMGPTRVQLDVWAATTDEAGQTAQAAVEVLAPGETSNGIQFGRTMFEIETDFAERLGEKDIYRVSLDMIVRHKAA